METTVGCRRTLSEWEYDEQSVPVIIGGYESGESPEGHDFYTFEPNLTTLELSFDTDDYDELVDRLFLLYGSIKIVGIGNGGLSGNSEAALHLDTYKSATDSLFVKEQTKKTRDSIDRKVREGEHVSRSVGFVFEEDIHLMPKGRVLENDRERERKDDDGKIVRTVTKATVVRSENDFFSLVDRGGSIEVIAEMWGLGRHCLMDVVKGRTHCKRESCEIPNRYPEYVERLERAKASGVDDPLFDPYRKMIRARQMKERLQCKVKSMETRVNGNKGV